MNNKKSINEDAIFGIKKHVNNHDTGLITAFRSTEKCGEGRPYTDKENQQRNRSLLAKLQEKGYGVVRVKGSYVQNYGSPIAKEIGGDVFFVIDLDDKGNLFDDIKKLGEEFGQDSVLFIPKEGKKCFLYGTNDCPHAFPEKGAAIYYKEDVFGDTGEFLAGVKKSPFVFRNEKLEWEEIPLPQGFFGKWGCHGIAKTPWEDIEV